MDVDTLFLTPEDTRSQIVPFLSTPEIDKWIESPTGEWFEKFEHAGVSLLEQLTNDIVKPDDLSHWHIRRMNRFLSRLESEMVHPKNDTQMKLASAVGVLMGFLIEAGPYRFEVRQTVTDTTITDLLHKYRSFRLQTLSTLTRLLDSSIFSPIREAVNFELKPMLSLMCELHEGTDNRFMPFRMLLAGAFFEQLRIIRLRVNDRQNSELGKLLDDVYALKTVRFGTSGYRGVWNRDFDERGVCVVTQAICDYLNLLNMPKYASQMGEKLSGRVIVVGYDGRRNSSHVANIIAEVCLANGFRVFLASRATPTPALNFFAREVVGVEQLAGIVNCTASHNPPEWQGIKFNPRQGYPAPTSLTDIIASRSNVHQLRNTAVPRTDLRVAESRNLLRQFDPMNLYLDWLRKSGQSGESNRRLGVNLEAIKTYFSDKHVVLDPMYGAGTGYLSKILGELGVPHTSIHDERDDDLGGQTEVVRGIPRLEYANPEPDYIQPLIDSVIAEDAVLGLGLDTDADRFGAIDKGGVYIRPNQVLAMLVRYLGVEREERGRVVLTQSGLPMIDAISGAIPNNDEYRPPRGSVPAYADHAFYHCRVGRKDDLHFPNSYIVPVGIKYIIDVGRISESSANTSDAYKTQEDSTLPSNWMDRILIGGEESSGLTTRGHVPDKDGIWANLLIMDMLAYYGLKLERENTSLLSIWQATTQMEVAWKTFGTRIDLDTTLEAKEALINFFLDAFNDWRDSTDGLPTLAGLEVYYLGGVRYDFVEVFLSDDHYGRRHFLRVRSSGTEPITRVYVDSADQEIAQRIISVTLEQLDLLTLDVIRQAYNPPRLADLLSNTRLSERTFAAARETIEAKSWSVQQIVDLLEERCPHIESRNVSLVRKWIDELQ